MTPADRERLADELADAAFDIAETLRGGGELSRDQIWFVRGWCQGCLDAGSGSSSSDFIRFLHRVLEEVSA